MSIHAWWSRLPPTTQDWLVAHNGGGVPVAILEQIERAGGPARSDPWWTHEEISAGPVMPDTAVDWIDEVANGETPGAR
jgi:hypothetical protein